MGCMALCEEVLGIRRALAAAILLLRKEQCNKEAMADGCATAKVFEVYTTMRKAYSATRSEGTKSKRSQTAITLCEYNVFSLSADYSLRRRADA